MKKISLIAIIINYALSSELSNVLKEAEEIATTLKLNIQDMPSSIRVLRESDFKLIGAKNLYEALNILPGIDLSMLSQGWKYPIIRGQQSAFLSGFDKIKLFIDNIAINDTTRGTSHFYLDFPIELIDRIEVFKGPNSAIYGSGAYSGAINVITKSGNILNSDKGAFLSTSTTSKDKAGFNYFYRDGDFLIKIDSYYQKENNSNEVKKLNLTSDKGEFSINNGTSDERLRDYSIGTFLKYRDISLYVRVKNEKTGNYFGVNEIIEQSPQEQIKKSVIAEINYEKDLDFAMLNLKAGFSSFKNSSDYEVAPKEIGYFYQDADGIDDISLFNTNIYKDESSLFEGILKFNRFYDNDLLIGLKHERIKSVENIFVENLDYSEEFYKSNYILPNSKREYISLYLQDIYSINDKFDISAFYRFDEYKNEKAQHSLQLGAIYRFTDNFKFKTVYNKAYRLPSWVEQSFSSLEAEKLEGIESSFLYENLLKTQSLELSLFKYSMPNNIDVSYSNRTSEPYFNRVYMQRANNNSAFVLEEESIVEPPAELIPPVPVGPTLKPEMEIESTGDMEDIAIENDEVKSSISETTFYYSNKEELNSKGFEIEYSFKPNFKHLFNFSYTYVNSEKTKALSDDRVQLLKLIYSYRPNSKLSINNFLYYRDDIKQDLYNNEISSYTSFDMNIIYQYNKNHQYSLSVKNAFNEDIRYKSTTGMQKDGLKRDDREIFFGYKFIF